MEQMETPVLPKGDADVTGVKTVVVGQHGHDVAIFHRLQCAALLPSQILLGNIAELLPANIVFHQADSRNVFWIHGQHTVF